MRQCLLACTLALASCQLEARQIPGAQLDTSNDASAVPRPPPARAADAGGAEAGTSGRDAAPEDAGAPSAAVVDGALVSPWSGPLFPRSLAIVPASASAHAGKVLALALMYDGNQYPYLTRSAGGQGDVTFGANGGVGVTTTTVAHDLVDVAADSQGRAIVGGYREVRYDGRPEGGVSVMRFNAAGTQDSAYGTGGFGAFNPSYGYNQTVTRLAVTPGDGVAVIGWANRADGRPGPWVVKLGEDGKPAAGFGAGIGGNPAWLPLPATDRGMPTAVHVDASGRLFIAGGTACVAATMRTTECTPFVLRLDAAGALDTTFGSSGIAAYPGAPGAAGSARGITVDAQGRVLVVGGVSSAGASRMFVARYTSAGAPDTAFGAGGVALINATSDAGQQQAETVAVLPNGDVVVSGCWASGTHNLGVVARLDASGQPVTTFGTGGIRTWRSASAGLLHSPIRVTDDGRILFLVITGEGATRRLRIEAIDP